MPTKPIAQQEATQAQEETQASLPRVKVKVTLQVKVVLTETSPQASQAPQEAFKIEVKVKVVFTEAPPQARAPQAWSSPSPQAIGVTGPQAQA